MLKPQMAPFTLAMKGILGVQAAGLRPQAVSGLAFLHRLPFVPDVALPPIVVMALGAAHPPGFMELVAELNRRLTAGFRARNFKRLTAGGSLRTAVRAPKRTSIARISPAT